RDDLPLGETLFVVQALDQPAPVEDIPPVLRAGGAVDQQAVEMDGEASRRAGGVDQRAEAPLAIAEQALHAVVGDLAGHGLDLLRGSLDLRAPGDYLGR